MLMQSHRLRRPSAWLAEKGCAVVVAVVVVTTTTAAAFRLAPNLQEHSLRLARLVAALSTRPLPPPVCKFHTANLMRSQLRQVSLTSQLTDKLAAQLIGRRNLNKVAPACDDKETTLTRDATSHDVQLDLSRIARFFSREASQTRLRDRILIWSVQS